jgi:hypothetical protein
MCFVNYQLLFSSPSCILLLLLLIVLQLTLVQGHQFLVSYPPLPEEGTIQADPISVASEAPKTDEGLDGDDAKVSLEESSSTSSPSPTNLEEPSLDKKRKRLGELLSSSTSVPRDAPGEPSTPNPSEVEIFDALDS